MDEGVLALAGKSELRSPGIAANRSRAFGFGGKLCIHPSQVAAVEEVLAPTMKELEWARRVVAEAKARNGETFSLDGKMVNLLVVRLADRTLLQDAGM